MEQGHFSLSKAVVLLQTSKLDEFTDLLFSFLFLLFFDISTVHDEFICGVTTSELYYNVSIKTRQNIALFFFPLKVPDPNSKVKLSQTGTRLKSAVLANLRLPRCLCIMWTKIAYTLVDELGSLSVQ